MANNVPRIWHTRYIEHNSASAESPTGVFGGDIPGMPYASPGREAPEFDYETGLYNYNARLYDQETGRFLQPDPVHAEHVGYDNYDRYQYVHSNPVNFTDPTGETAVVAGMGMGSAMSGLLALALVTGLYNQFRFGKFVPLTVGYYEGAGANKRAPLSKGTLMAGLTFAMFVNSFPDTPETIPRKQFLNLLLMQMYVQGTIVDSPEGLFETDKTSRIHDRDGPDFHRHHSNQANNRWVRRNWALWTSGKMFRRTWDRELKAVPDYWGDARPLVAAVNTAFTLYGEMHLTVMGTLLFKTANALNDVWYAWKKQPRLNVNAGRYRHWHTPRKWKL